MDDLIPEESETVQKALKRLPPKEAYDRVFRMRRAFQVSGGHGASRIAHWCFEALSAKMMDVLILTVSPVLSSASTATKRSMDQAGRSSFRPSSCYLVSFHLLHPTKWTWPRLTMYSPCHLKQDEMYLTPYIQEVESEARERDDLESMTIFRRAKKTK